MTTAEARELGKAAFRTGGPRAVSLREDMGRFLDAAGDLDQPAVSAYMSAWDEANIAERMA